MKYCFVFIDTLHFEIQAAGFLSALPYLVMSITLQIAGVLVDKLRSKNYFTTTQVRLIAQPTNLFDYFKKHLTEIFFFFLPTQIQVRKIFNCGAFLSQTVFMISAAFAETAFFSILFITLAVGLGAFSWAAFR